MYKFLFSLFLFLSPFTASAVFTHNFVCSDFTSFAGSPAGTCTGSTISLTAGSGYVDNWVNGVNYFTQGTTYYLSFLATGSGTGHANIASDATDSNVVNVVAGQTTETSLSGFTSGSTRLIFSANSSFSGTITNICVTDTIGQCPAVVPSSSSATTTPQPFGTTTTYHVVDNPNQDLFNGFLTFFLSFFVVLFIVKNARIV